MRRSVVHMVAVIGLLAVPILTLAGQASPALLAHACAACHGPDGQSPGTIPALHGKTAQEIAQQLTAFKTDRQRGTVMNRIAKGYTDAEIAAIASFLGKK